MSDISWPNPDRAIGKRIASNIAKLRVATRLMGTEEKIVKLVLVSPKDEILGPDGSLVIDEKTIREDIELTANKLFIYKGRLITLHIYEPFSTLRTMNMEPERGCKVHFTHCGALTQMRNSGKYSRYVAGDRIDGTFKCHLIEGYSWGKQRKRKIYFVRLLPCRKCLKKLNYKNFADISLKRDEYEMRKIVKEFNYEEFFKEIWPKQANPDLGLLRQTQTEQEIEVTN